MKPTLLVLAVLAAFANAAAIDLLSAVWGYGSCLPGMLSSGWGFGRGEKEISNISSLLQKAPSASLSVIHGLAARICNAGRGIRLEARQ